MKHVTLRWTSELIMSLAASETAFRSYCLLFTLRPYAMFFTQTPASFPWYTSMAVRCKSKHQ